MTEVWSILRKLPPEQQQVILLREMNGLSYDEISNVAGISRQEVAQRLRDARRELLARLHGGISVERN